MKGLKSSALFTKAYTGMYMVVIKYTGKRNKHLFITLLPCQLQRHLGDLCKRSTVGSVGTHLHPPPPPLNGQWPWLTRHHNQRQHNKGKYGLSSMSLQLVKEASISTSRCMSSSHYAYVP